MPSYPVHNVYFYAKHGEVSRYFCQSGCMVRTLPHFNTVECYICLFKIWAAVWIISHAPPKGGL